MLKKKILTYSKDDLLHWIDEVAGSRDPKYFGCKKGGRLRLQQNPYEYAAFLDWLRVQDVNSYMEIGIGDGGSFMINSLFSGAQKVVAVDDLSYEKHGIQKRSRILKKIRFLKRKVPKVTFYESDSAEFLKSHDDRYDIVFIDGDHSYEGVKQDYALCKANNFIIFHDIANANTGVKQLWDEIKTDDDIEFIENPNTGIGIKKVIAAAT